MLQCYNVISLQGHIFVHDSSVLFSFFNLVLHFFLAFIEFVIIYFECLGVSSCLHFQRQLIPVIYHPLCEKVSSDLKPGVVFEQVEAGRDDIFENYFFESWYLAFCDIFENFWHKG